MQHARIVLVLAVATAACGTVVSASFGDARDVSLSDSIDGADGDWVDVRRESGGETPGLDAGFARCGISGLACDPIDNRGCAGESECRLRRSADGQWVGACLRAARSINGTPCAAAEDCALGFLCLEESAGGRCRALCCQGDPFDGSELCRRVPNAMCELPRALCDSPIGAGRMSVCVPEGDCSPWLRNTCAVGRHCVPISAGGGLGCLWHGMVGVGEVCSALSDCVEGTVCAATTGGTAPRCRRICDPLLAATDAGLACAADRPRACEAGLRCVALSRVEPPLGVCVP